MQEYYNLDLIELCKTNPMRAAILACGLRAESRIIQKISKIRASTSEMLLASISDEIAIFTWKYFGGKGQMPELNTKRFTEPDKPQQTYKTFSSHDAFMRWREQFNEE